MMRDAHCDQFPDLAARQQAEGGRDEANRRERLRYPDYESSSELPVESGALEDEEMEGGK